MIHTREKTAILVLTAILFYSCQQDYSSRPGTREPVIARLPVMDISCNVDDTLLQKTDEPCIIHYANQRRQVTDNEALIRLRGNSTSEFPKRPFRIHLSDQTAFEGMPRAHSWALLANWLDRTMLRTALAFRMSEDSRMDYTPRSCFIHVNYNNDSRGVYQLTELIRESPNRLSLPENGWLAEMDIRTVPGEIIFTVPHMPSPCRIRWPEMQPGDPRIAQIKAVFLQAEQALFSDNFTDKENGWRKYMDEESWVEWYVLNEIAKNNDAIFFSSCYLHSAPDGKLKMGPVWDFDMGYGNAVYFMHTDPPEGFHVRSSEWYTRLWQDPCFRDSVRTRFEWFYNRRFEYYGFIHSKAQELLPYIVEEDSVRRMLCDKDALKEFYPDSIVAPIQAYNEEVRKLIDWTERRFVWIKNNLPE